MSALLSLTRRGALALATAMILAPAAMAEDKVLKVGIMGGEDETVWGVIAEQAKPLGLTIETVIFNDYTQPNEALSRNEVDANAFQHQPYLDSQIGAHGYEIVPVIPTYIQPIGVYSTKVKSVEELPEGATIGLPNDPSNSGRALKVLEALGLIKLNPEAGVLATVLDVTENPKNFDLRELDAGVVGRAIEDLDAAVINTDWAAKAELLEARIASESSEGNPYTNFVAVRAADKDAAWVADLKKAYHNDAVKASIIEVYKGSTVPAF